MVNSLPDGEYFMDIGVGQIPPRLPIKMEEKLVRTHTAKPSPSRAASAFVRKK